MRHKTAPLVICSFVAARAGLGRRTATEYGISRVPRVTTVVTCGWRGASRQARLILLFQSIAFALDHERVTVVEQPIEDRGCEHGQNITVALHGYPSSPACQYPMSSRNRVAPCLGVSRCLRVGLGIFA